MAIQCRPAHFQSPQFRGFFLIITAGNADHEPLWRGFNCAIKVITASSCLAKPISISYRSQEQNCSRDFREIQNGESSQKESIQLQMIDAKLIIIEFVFDSKVKFKEIN